MSGKQSPHSARIATSSSSGSEANFITPGVGGQFTLTRSFDFVPHSRESTHGTATLLPIRAFVFAGTRMGPAGAGGVTVMSTALLLSIESTPPNWHFLPVLQRRPHWPLAVLPGLNSISSMPGVSPKSGPIPRRSRYGEAGRGNLGTSSRKTLEGTDTLSWQPMQSCPDEHCTQSDVHPIAVQYVATLSGSLQISPS